MADSVPPDILDQDSPPVKRIKREFTALFCDPCFEDGNHLETEGYCVDCAQHLCLRCFQHHRTPTLCRNHRLLDRHQMPQTKPDKVFMDECTDKCSRHKNELIKYYCKGHEEFGCSVCMTIGHRTCHVDYIPDLAEDLFNSAEYKTFKGALESLIQKTTSIKAKTSTNLKDAKNRADASVSEIRKLRKEVDDFFDKLEQNITTELTKIQAENHNTITAIGKQNGAIADEVKHIHQDLLDKESKKQRCRLFVDTKQLQQIIIKLKTDLNKLEKMNRIREVAFTPSLSVTNFIRDQGHVFGSLVDFYRTVPVISPSDKSLDCFISNITVLSGERSAVYDSNNNTVKVIDTQQGTVVTTKSHGCSGLATKSDNELAVINNFDIEIYTVTDKLKLKKSIWNIGLQWSIVYTNNTFIGVTHSTPPTLRMVNMNGDIIRTFPTELNGEAMFEHPCYMTLSPDHTLIYVSDSGNNTVTCLTLKGTMQARYKPVSKWEPRGVAVSGDGVVYVCDHKNNNIRILTPDLKVTGVIHGPTYGICKPVGLAYCGRESKLYVGMGGGQVMGVVKI